MGGGEVPGLLKHFYFIMKEFLQSRKHVSKKVQAICLWWHKPVIDQELLQSLPNLKVIVNSGAGVDHLDLKLVASFGVKMAHAPCAVSSSTADRLVEGYSGMEYCKDNFLGVIVTGTTLGIVGMGSTMYKTILRAKAFEMNVLYHNRTQKEQEEQPFSASYCETIDNLHQWADCVMVMSLTPQTHSLIGERQMELMKTTAPLTDISVAVDQDPLLTAMQAGKPEMFRDYTLLQLNDIIIMPHLGIKADKTTYMITEEAIANILAALHCLPIPSEVLPS
uniref:Uncharacterized protein n=1 Tax=Amazona collaria TaxID=241587 RepID=A0A8B9EUD3_9PSIT